MSDAPSRPAPAPQLGIELQQRFGSWCSAWQLKNRRLSFAGRPRLMGILNVTPDSFSDGGRFFSVQQAVDQAHHLVDAGADLLDVGGESTRPYSTPVDESEQLRRVMPVLERICPELDVPVSIDTSRARVAREALAAGAEIINDVTGLEGDADMVSVALESGAGLCVMHMQGTPQTMQDHPQYDDVVQEILQYLAWRCDFLAQAGIPRDRICLDPGIGFGKTHQHNLDLVAGCGQLHGLGCPLLVGHSRKGFLAKILGDKQLDRTAATVGVALMLARLGVQVIRVHDIQPVQQALLAFEAVGGIDERPWRLPSEVP